MSSAYIDGFVQERLNSIVNTLEVCLSCTNPSISRMQLYQSVKVIFFMSFSMTLYYWHIRLSRDVDCLVCICLATSPSAKIILTSVVWLVLLLCFHGRTYKMWTWWPLTVMMVCTETVRLYHLLPGVVLQELGCPCLMFHKNLVKTFGFGYNKI